MPKPLLVLLPGMDGTGDLFSPLLEALNKDIETLLVRYPDQPLSYAQHEEIARAALPSDRPYMLLGESFSGPIAVSLAAAAPGTCQGLILCASFLTCPSAVLTWLRSIISLLPLRQVPRSLAVFSLMGRYATPALRELYGNAIRKASPATLRARLMAISEVDARDTFNRLDVPVLYLRATEDRMVPPSSSREAVAINPKVCIVDIAAPHFLLQVDPAGAAKAISNFMSHRSAGVRETE